MEEKVSSNTATVTFSILLKEVSVFGGGRTLYTVRKHIPGTFQVKTIETVYKTGKECENMISPPSHPSFLMQSNRVNERILKILSVVKKKIKEIVPSFHRLKEEFFSEEVRPVGS